MSETSEKVIDKIIDNATSRLRIPIVSTYIIVLLFHNWDLVYYLLFQSGEATTKIAYIKKHYPNYWGGIFEAVGIAICVLVIVSCLDLLLTYILKEVYKNKKKIVDKINNYKSFEELENALTTQINETVRLSNLNEDLKNQNSKLVENFNNTLKSINDDKNNIDIGRIINNIIHLESPHYISLFDKFNILIELLDFLFNSFLDKKKYIKRSDIFSEKIINDPTKNIVVTSIINNLVELEYIGINKEKIEFKGNMFRLINLFTKNIKPPQ